MKEIVEHPQYIVETNKPYTALILKEFSEGEDQFKTVLRLTTSHDNPDFKNSIIIMNNKVFEVEIMLLHTFWVKRNAGWGTPAKYLFS